jgi:hypothetical protein
VDGVVALPFLHGAVAPAALSRLLGLRQHDVMALTVAPVDGDGGDDDGDGRDSKRDDDSGSAGGTTTTTTTATTTTTTTGQGGRSPLVFLVSILTLPEAERLEDSDGESQLDRESSAVPFLQIASGTVRGVCPDDRAGVTLETSLG